MVNIQSKKVAISTVNYRTPDLTCNAIDSVIRSTKQHDEIRMYVVDNDSQDNSVAFINEYIENKKQDNVSLLIKSKNGGFAYGSNVGIRNALKDNADYILLLNPDTQVREGAIEALVEFLETHSDVGVAGSQLENLDGEIENSAHNFHSPLSELIESARLGFLSRLFPKSEITPPRQQSPHQCDWVSGASMMVRSDVFDDIGLLDESYFLYFEEVDFFFRAQQAGWQTWYVPDSKVMHIEGAATGIKSTKRRPRYWYESRRRFFVKHYGVFGLILADIFWTVGRTSYLLRRFLKLGAQKESNDPKWMMYDLLIGDIWSIVSTRAWRLPKEKVK